ncbi:MAG TPA: hypothetical protein VF548_14600 [Allosphingosinicella sp.]|jgi:hypothetical protein
MERLRSFFDHLRFKASLRARAGLEIAIAVAGLGLIALALAGVGGRSRLDIVGWVLTLLGAYLVFRDILGRSRRRLDVRASNNEAFPEIAERAKPPEGFQKLAFGEKLYVTSDEINRLLDAASNPVVLAPDKFEVPPQIRAYREQGVAQSAPDYNEKKVGLRTDLTPALLGGNLPVTVQRSDYFSGISTNEVARQRFERCEDGRRRRKWAVDFVVSALVFEGDQLIDLADSVLANNVGVTALLLTSDHHIVLQEQGSQAVDSRRINLGSSGSLDVSDLYQPAVSGGKSLSPLQDVLRRGMEREAAEETGAAVGPGRSATVLTGYARYLHRGGKPEFFGIIRTASDFDSLGTSRSERKFVHRIHEKAFEPTPAGLIDAIEKLALECESEPDRYSPSMAVGLRLARSYLERCGLDLSPLPGS